MKPDSIIKDIVNAVKSKEELAGVTCVCSNGREFAQNPVCSFTLCIGIGKSKYEKDPDSSSPTHSTEFNLCLLAPSGAGGKRLCEVSYWVAEAIKESLNVRAIEICEPQYNDTSSALFTDIVVTVEDTSLADAIFSLYIDAEKAQGVVYFEAESTEQLEKQAELLNGYSFVKTFGETYVIKLKVKSPLNVKGEEFEIKSEYEGFGEIYKGCRINKLKRELNQLGNLSFTYEIIAKSCELFEKEGQDE